VLHKIWIVCFEVTPLVIIYGYMCYKYTDSKDVVSGFVVLLPSFQTSQYPNYG
jgi:hypothetical protein